MKKYESPEIEVTALNFSDVIATSGEGTVDVNGLPMTDGILGPWNL